MGYRRCHSRGGRKAASWAQAQGLKGDNGKPDADIMFTAPDRPEVKKIKIDRDAADTRSGEEKERSQVKATQAQARRPVERHKDGRALDSKRLSAPPIGYIIMGHGAFVCVM